MTPLYESIGRALSALLDAEVVVSARAGTDCGPGTGSVAVRLVGDARPDETWLVVAEAALVVNVVARATRRPAPKVADGTRGAAEIAGAFAAVVAATARRALPGAPRRIGAVEELKDLAGPSPASAVEIGLRVTVEGVAYAASLVAPAAAIVTAHVEIASVELSAAEWAGLRAGDVVILAEGTPKRVTLRAAGSVVGQGELVMLDGKLGVRILERDDASTASDATMILKEAR